jgi:hypothetical protein
MADDAKIGTHWQEDELDAIVADYFAMLEADLAGRPYVKLQHSKALMSRIGRTHRSVEFKHQNISAVLEELGMPWIPGYKPKRNYQRAIFDAIDRYLTARPDILCAVAPSPRAPSPDEVFVHAPRLIRDAPLPAPLRRLIRKFDPVERDRLNHALGRGGEEFVIDVEKRRLAAANRSDLARRIRWVAEEEGDGAGYDVLSFEATGHEKLLEVKTTNGPARTPFFLTRNERQVAMERAADWRIYRVHMFSTEPRIFTIGPPLEDVVDLSPETWRASFSRIRTEA